MHGGNFITSLRKRLPMVATTACRSASCAKFSLINFMSKLLSYFPFTIPSKTAIKIPIPDSILTIIERCRVFIAKDEQRPAHMLWQFRFCKLQRL